MRILVDVDGVLADFIAHTLASVPNTLTRADITTLDIFDLLGPEGLRFQNEGLKDPDWWAALPVMDGAQDGIESLRIYGAELGFVTSPWWSCFGWETVRRDWLERHFDVDGKDVIPTHRKEWVEGDAILDDKEENVRKWQAQHPNGKAFLFNQPYNDRSDWPNRADWMVEPFPLQICWPVHHLQPASGPHSL